MLPAVTGKVPIPSQSSRILSVSKNKRRDRVDNILTQVCLSVVMVMVIQRIYWDITFRQDVFVSLGYYPDSKTAQKFHEKTTLEFRISIWKCKNYSYCMQLTLEER